MSEVGTDLDARLKIFKDLFKVSQDNRNQNKLKLLYANKMSQEYFDACCKYECKPDGRPYPWQVEFHNASADFSQRAILASNQSGKTLSCAADVAIHATGLYPDWWEGHRFLNPIDVCMGSETNEMLRDLQQKNLYGGLLPEGNMPDGTGWIPKSCIVDVKPRQCGIAGVYDEVKVRHVTGGISTVKGKTYQQGWTTWQGGQFNLYWLDEEPVNDNLIWSEVQRGLISRGGMVILSRTPLLGMTNIVQHFMGVSENENSSAFYMNVTIEQCPHISQKDKDDFVRGLQPHEIEARTKGIPMLGEGAIYPVSDEHISYEAFSIPKYFKRVCGMDFGDDHYTAACWVAYDADTDVIYIYDVYKARRTTIADNSSAIRDRGVWIPVAWPHDGMNKDKSGSGIRLKELYEDNFVNMLPISARYDDDKGGGQAREPIIQECFERMVSGRLKVASHLNLWFEEKRSYHRKDSRVVDKKDDLLSAMHYAVMMLRYARQDMEQSRQRMADLDVSSVNYAF